MLMDVTELMRKIGLEVSDEGMCLGLAMMALQAYLQGHNEYKYYSERLDKIKEWGSNLEWEKVEWTNIQAYLQGIALYQSAHAYPALFPTNKAISQYNIVETATVAQSKIIEDRGGIRQVSSFSGLYHDVDIAEYLQSYQQTLEERAQVNLKESSCALLLGCYGHAIMLAYNIDHSRWYLQDYDRRYEHNKADLASVIDDVKFAFRRCFKRGPLILSTTVISLGDTFSEANEIYSLWSRSTTWKQIHRITKEKAETVGKGGGWLYMAAALGDINLVKELLDKRADVDAATESRNYTPLFIAAQNDHVEVVKLLLEKGANVNAVTTLNFTPLHVAAEYGNLNVVKALLDKGADVDAVAKDGYTPLYLAAFDGRADTVKLLLEKNADINAMTDQGVTAFFGAVQNNHVEIDQYQKTKCALSTR